MNQQVKIRIPKKTAEECIVVVLGICSANIADHIYFHLIQEVCKLPIVYIHINDMICNVSTANIEDHNYALLSRVFRNPDLHLLIQT